MQVLSCILIHLFITANSLLKYNVSTFSLHQFQLTISELHHSNYLKNNFISLSKQQNLHQLSVII
jgi:hypothetical protein